MLPSITLLPPPRVPGCSAAPLRWCGADPGSETRDPAGVAQDPVSAAQHEGYCTAHGMTGSGAAPYQPHLPVFPDAPQHHFGGAVLIRNRKHAIQIGRAHV